MPQRVPSIEQLLDAEVCALDELLGEIRLGIRSSTHFDALEQRAAQIASGVRGAFRKGSRA
jgi:hypothetical protein